MVSSMTLAASPLPVAHVVESLEVGGLENLVVEFARHADRSRFALRVIALGERGRLADEVEAQGWPVVALRARPGLTPWTVVRLARLYRGGGVGVVHTHSEGPLLYGATAARLAGVPRVIHTRHHGPDLGNSRRVRSLMAMASRWTDQVVCVARDGARHSIEEGVPARKVMIVPNGVDVSRFTYAGPTPRGPAVVVGRLAPEKDHATLLRAAALVAREEPAFRLEIAGDGPCEAQLKSLAQGLGLADVVRFLGREDDVPARLGRAGLLVLPSLMEGMPLTLLEAMARGLPVVATSVGGNAEVVIHGKTGLLVPARSPGDLAAAMLGLWRDPEASRRIGRAGRERVEQSFDVRRTIGRYERIYRNLPDPME